MGVLIASIDYYLPENLITNERLLEIVSEKGGPGVDLEKLQDRLIINQAENRYFKNPEETGMSMAETAARKCLAKANFAARDLDCIIYVGMLRDYVEPAMAIILQDILEAPKAHAFDLANACNSFLNGMELSEMYLKTGKFNNVLLVGAEDGSTRIPWHLFNNEKNLTGFSSLTISDGAVAMLLLSEPSHPGFTGFTFKTFGQFHDLCKIRIGKGVDDLTLLVQSKKLAMTALRIMPQFIQDSLQQAQNELGKVDIWFLHQVTGDSRKFYGDLEASLAAKAYSTFSQVGNTGSLSIPLGMALAEQNGALKRGDCVAAVVGASGFSCGTTAFVY